MRKNILISFLLFLLLAQISNAAPAPWGLALNQQTKECAGYWAGDEFTGYRLPEGWKAYYPKYESGSSENSNWKKIQTEVGECSFQMRKEEACCMELGYSFVSDNIGKGQTEKLRDRVVPGNRADRFQVIFIRSVIIFSALILIGLIFLLCYLLKKWRSKKIQQAEDNSRLNK